MNPTPTPAPVDPNAPKPEGEGEKPVAVEPLTVEAIKLPEGFSTAPEQLSAFVDLLNNSELSRADLATKLIEMQAETLRTAAEKLSATWTQTRADWVKEATNDPEIGGANLDANLGQIKKLINDFGSPETIEALDLTGAGDNPHVIRFLFKVSKALGEGGPVSGAPAAGATQTAADRLYPSMRKPS